MNDSFWNYVVSTPAVGVDQPANPREPAPSGTSSSVIFRSWLPVAVLLYGAALYQSFNRPTIGFFTAGVAGCGVVIASLGSKSTTHSRARHIAMFVGLGSSFGLFWRTNVYLRSLDIIVVLGAMVLCSQPHLTFGRFSVRRLGAAVPDGVLGAFELMTRIGKAAGATTHGVTKRWGGRSSVAAKRMIIGLIFALPIAGLFALLLASADKVFASLIKVPNFDRMNHWIEVIVGTVFLGYGFGSLLVGSAAGPRTPSFRPQRHEGAVVLWCVNAVFAVFCAVQIVTALGGAKHVLATSGLTYAEYARSGFFQLLAVAVLDLTLLGVARWSAGPLSLTNRNLRLACALSALLTICITGVAIARMSLYMRAYGITDARVVAQAGAITVGAIFALVFIGVVWSTPMRDLRGFVSAGSFGIVALSVVSLHVLNPSAWAMRDALSKSSPVEVPEVAALLDDDSWSVVGAWAAKHPKVSFANQQGPCLRAEPSPSLLDWTIATGSAQSTQEELCGPMSL